MKAFADRLKKGMELRNLRQADIVEKTGINKGALSSYLSGRYEPKQNNVFLLAKVLDVNEAWLMGADVPMDRNDYEDQNLLSRDSIFQDIDNLLENAGYKLVCASYDDGLFMVQNSCGQTISTFYDYDLLARYNSLKQRGEITAELLISSDSAFEKYLESLGYRIFQDDPEHRPFLSTGKLTVRLGYDTLDKLKDRIEKYTRASIDSKMLSLKEDELREERLMNEQIILHLTGNTCKEDQTNHLYANAANQRPTVTEENKKHSNDIMHDDKEWTDVP